MEKVDSMQLIFSDILTGVIKLAMTVNSLSYILELDANLNMSNERRLASSLKQSDLESISSIKSADQKTDSLNNKNIETEMTKDFNRELADNSSTVISNAKYFPMTRDIQVYNDSIYFMFEYELCKT